jgi:hypothetical protein
MTSWLVPMMVRGSLAATSIKLCARAKVSDISFLSEAVMMSAS